MSLRSVDIDITYEGNDAVIQDFLQPCLENSVKLQRISGYFSSAIFSLVKGSFLEFASKGGKIELICSPHLDEKDLEKIYTGYELRPEILNEVIGDSVINEIKETLLLSNSGLKYDFISYLIAIDTLNIKIAHKINQKGIMHAKKAIFWDVNGDFITTNGSNNETVPGLLPEHNWESFHTFKSWVDVASEYAYNDKKAFDSMWDNSAPGLSVIPFPEHTKEELMKLRSNRTPTEILEEIDTNSFHVPRLPTPRSHQEKALDKWKNNNYRGIFEHATGSGKTISAILAISEWFNKKSGPVIVTVPSLLLLEQWESEFRKYFSNHVNILVVGGNHNEWKKGSNVEDFSSKYVKDQNRIILGTNHSLRTDKFLSKLDDGDHLLIVSDEVHNIGAKENSKILSIHTGGQLGLSATPIRYSDPDGTSKIFDYFGNSIDTYSLKNAIDDGHLVPYLYYPQKVNLLDNEREEWSRRSKKITKLYWSYKKSKSDEDFIKLKNEYIQRSRIIKSAAVKKDIPHSVLSDKYSKGDRWLIYCDTKEQLKDVEETLHDYRRDVIKYYYDMPARQKKLNIEKFNDIGGILLSINCLDEGVDIPSISNAIILSSSKNKRQFIQRRGRVLRKYTNKNNAYIYDCVVVPPRENIQDEVEYKGELRRAIEFSKDSMNSVKQFELKKLADEFNIDLTEDEEDYEAIEEETEVLEMTSG